MKRVFVIGLLVLALSVAAAAEDVYIKQKAHTDGFAMMGQETPAKDEFYHMWLSDNKMAMQMPSMGLVVDMEKNIMFWINHESKNYVEMALPLDLDKYFPEQMRQMMTNVKVSVASNGEQKTIGEWDCEGYDMDLSFMGMEMKQKMWTSTKVPFDWKEYAEKLMPKMYEAMFQLGDASLQELLKIQGFLIRQETSMAMMGNEIKSWQEVVEIEKKSAPAGTFGVPEGYTKKDKLDFMDLQRR
jgi:hypothetical protein